MNRKLKTILIAGLISAMLAFTACGNNSGNNADATVTPEATATVTPTPAATSTPIATPTPEPAPAAKSYKFDFGCTTDRTLDGWNAITGGLKKGDGTTGYEYTKEKGYGFTGVECIGSDAKMNTEETYGIPLEIYDDYIIAKGGEFVADIENGTYNVQIICASRSTSTNVFTVEGTKYETEGYKGKIELLTVNNVKIEDGQLNVGIDGSGILGGYMSALLVFELDAATNLVGEPDIDACTCKLTWTASPNAESYNVYRTDADGNTVIFRSVTGTEYTDTTPEMLKTYTYSVKSVFGFAAESEATNEVSFRFADPSIKMPEQVTGLAVSELTATSTTLTWDVAPNATTYYIYASDRERPNDKGVDSYTLLGYTENTSYTIEGYTNLARYYKVQSANQGGFATPTLVRAEAGLDYEVQIEKLTRGLNAVKTKNGVYLGWRLFAYEYAEGVTFELYRDGAKIADFSAEDNTSYLDENGTENSKYVVKTYNNGVLVDTSEEVSVLKEQYLEIPIKNPQPGYYSANDMSVGDVDGDGEYELFVKWDPSDSKDNSQSGVTGKVYIDCYEFDGTLLWRIDLGINIRAGAHYTQYMVYDFDGDGKAEMICKTADGTVDGAGTVIGDAAADYRNSGGYVLDGPEFLTLFEGATGKALHTIDYNPQRGAVSAWGDSYGNRVDRFLAGVAYLDGEHPSAIICRGYYTRAVIVAYDVVDGKLVERWVCDSNNKENSDLKAQGAHSLSIGDVDSDGCDEIIYGSATVDNDGKFMYSLITVNGSGHGGHGDALHVSDFNLDDTGLEVFMVHENKPLNAGIEMHNAESGEYVFGVPTTKDIGRGAAADIIASSEGAEAWADGTIYASDGTVLVYKAPAANFVIWWDADLGREILDHSNYTPAISKWSETANSAKLIFSMMGCSTNNGTKANPGLQADLFGDWREEVAVRTSDSSAVRIYTNTDVCDYRIYTLMHDTQYRCAIAWQTTGYNQPPHPSFYIGYDKDLIEIPVKNYKLAE